MKIRYWSKADEDFLREHYLIEGRQWCANALGRSPESVTQKMRRMKDAGSHSDQAVTILEPQPKSGWLAWLRRIFTGART